MTKKRLLIVEDERIVAQELYESLNALNYEVLAVLHSGEDAVDQATRTRPDLVLMDILLPGALDGIDAAAQLQAIGIPVVYITGYSDQHLRDRAQYTEPLAYLFKPIQTRELATVLQLALFRQEKDQERRLERQKHAAALYQSEEQFRVLVEGATEYAMFTLDLLGNVQNWTMGAERILGYTAEQIRGHSFAVLFTSQDRQQDVPQKELDHANKHGVADDSRWLVRRNGEYYWAEGTLTALRDPSGVVTGFAKITRDATERRHAQEALRQSEERLRIALHAARMGTWQWNIRTNEDIIDSSLRGLFGLRPGQEIKTVDDFFAVVHPEDRTKVQDAFKRTQLEGIHLNTEFRVTWPDGSEHWLLDQGEVLRDLDGEPAYLTGACVDITERKQAEKALRESKDELRRSHEQVEASLKEKEVLLKEIHHRVKNNLQVIVSLLTLQSGTVADETVTSLFEESCNRVRAIAVIHELLYKSPDLARIDFNAYLDQLAKNLFSFYGVDQNRVKLLINCKNAELEINQAIPCGLVVNELLTNSLKHAFPGGRLGRIRVSLDCVDGTCVLDVADDGVGVSDGFEIEESNSLGLKLVSVLADQLQGRMRFVQDGEMRFSIAFPRVTRHRT